MIKCELDGFSLYILTWLVIAIIIGLMIVQAYLI